MELAYLTIKPVRLDIIGLPRGPGGTDRVTIESPLKARKAVYQIACMFRREAGYDMTQYGHDGREDDPHHRAFLWTDFVWGDRAHESGLYAVGACCFRQRSASDWAERPAWAADRYWALQWVWLHPFYRRKKLLINSWAGFREEFGEFDIEHPFSPAMWFFMAKHAPWMWARIPPRCVPQFPASP